MKETLIAPDNSQSIFPFTTETLPYACLLGVASLLALAGGTATSVLFFGLLLSFSLLILGGRRLGGARARRAAQSQSK